MKFLSLSLALCLVGGATAFGEGLRAGSAQTPVTNGIGGADAYSLNHAQFDYIGPREPQRFLMRLEEIRAKGRRLRAADGGTLSESHRLMMQSKLDLLLEEHQLSVRVVSARSIPATEKWGRATTR